jgi:Ca2+-binding RTX toxin-like protein
LQQATLDYSKSGGGVVSYVEGVRGGFTIAYGAWIENATSGSGDDWLQGSLRANKLNGGAGRDTVDYSNRYRPIEVKLAGAVAAGVSVDGKAEDIILNIENFVGGAAGDRLIGDSFGNWLTGGGGNDFLRGKGGNDRFVFSTKLNAGNADTIADFKHNADVLALDDRIFKAIGSALTSGEFYAKAGVRKGHDKDDRLVYNTTTGDLYYDKDGKGGTAAVLFATLSNHPTSLDYQDFLIV